MGGLIARQYLINCKKNQVDIKKYRMLITYATPHKGSYIADKLTIKRIKLVSYLYTKFSIFFKYRISPQIGDLASLNEFIRDVEADWSRYNVGLGLNFIRVVAKKDLLVKPESAMQNDKEVEFIKEFEYNHTGIINPSKTDLTFEPINYFIERLTMLEYEEEIYEELIPEINYDNFDDSENIETY
jgi:triacylglycerol esterase/lipase EstA (alpha/beta hydrolase family)